MNGLNGFTTLDGEICLGGPLVEERKAADDAVGPSEWPWSGAFMQGDVRAAVAWPSPGMGRGVLVLAVLDPRGMLRVVGYEEYDRVATMVDPSGAMRQGLGMLIRDVVSIGVRQVCIQADNAVTASAWWALIRKDPSMAGASLPFYPITEMEQAVAIWREMLSRIVVPMAVATPIKMAEVKGEMCPLGTAVAMLAASYKVVTRVRVRPQDARWEEWR